MIAGPIIRYRQIADQLASRAVSLSDVEHGVLRFVTGLAKKLIIADPLGQIADVAFGVSAGQLSPGAAWLGVVCYGLPFLRPPAAFPQNISPHTFRRISAWFNDRLGMRYPQMVLDSHWRLRVWQLRFRGDVLFGNGPWLFFNDNPPEPAARSTDLRGELRMAEADIATLGRQMAAMQTQLAACGKTALVVVAPNKQSIYPEQLREGDGYRRSRVDDVLARLGPQARSLFVDPRPELRADKSRHNVRLYYQTDSHWNDLGAFIAYQKIVSTLAKANAIERPDLASLEGVSVDTEPFAGGDVATRILYLPWNFADRRVVLRGSTQIPLVVHSERDRLVITNAQRKGKLVS